MRPHTLTRRGSVLPLLAVTCIALFGFVALAVDLGMLVVARTECQNAADSAALSGARMLDNDYPVGGSSTAYDNKRLEAIAAAKGGGTASPANGSNSYLAGVKGNYLMNANFAFSDTAVDKVEVGIYDYDAAGTQTFQPKFPTTNPTAKMTGSDGSIRPWTAVRVTVKGDQPAYFARIFGVTTMPMSAVATAVHRPRDVAVVVDFSGSMRFGSTPNYPPGNGNSNGAVIGLLNPDPRFPRFGHFSRYDGRQTTNPNGASPHPFQINANAPYVMGSGEIQTPHNLTYDSFSGPPMVNDFYYYPTSGLNVKVTDPTLLKPAFNSSLSGGNYSTQICPVDEDYGLQQIALGTILGDRSPRKGGIRLADPTATGSGWTDATNGAASNVRELLTGGNTAAATERTITRTGSYLGVSQATITPGGNSKEGGTLWRNYYDDAWERRGYDLDIPAYRASGWSTATNRTTELFQGYTLGPGYWGKSFFTWPPDPRYGNYGADMTQAGNQPNVTSPDPNRLSHDTNGRPMCDWRRRFFLKSDSTRFNPQVDNVNGLLLSATAGSHTLAVTTPTGNSNSTTTTFRVNYPAVLAWLKSGPQTLPPNLRAGRILYYDAIPNDCTTPANDNERFFREYIDFVLGVTVNRTWYNPAFCLAGVEPTGWGTFGFTSTQAYTPTGSTTPNPKPYMTYTDTPNMPRAHFWFGPYTMLCYLSTRGGFTGSGNMGYNWMAGTVREAQCWQVKAGIQSGIDDVRKNHPNDQMGLSFFAYSGYRTPRCNMGQDFDRMKAALFFPNSFLNDVLSTTYNNREERPYNTSMGERLSQNLPNADGATDPNNGLAIAYNMLSPVTSGAAGAGGRRGAAKIVIFETDGVPNSYQNWDFVAAGVNSKYNWIDAGASPGNGDQTSIDEAHFVISQIAASTTASSPGFSLPNAPARVYSIAFGDLFTSNSTFKPIALSFLQEAQYRGNALASETTALPPEQIITGDYNTRITNLRSCLERIFQGGVQVALVE